MTRTEFINGIEEIGQTLTNSGLEDLLVTVIKDPAPDETKERSKKILNALKDYTFKAHNFSPAARRIVEIMEMEDLEDSDTWFVLMGEVERDYVEDKLVRIRAIDDVLPVLSEIIHRHPRIFGGMSTLLQEIEEDDGTAADAATQPGADGASVDVEATTTSISSTPDDAVSESDDDEMARLFQEHVGE